MMIRTSSLLDVSLLLNLDQVLEKIEQHLHLPTPVLQINHPLFEQKKVDCFVKRDELIHPDLCGNKWRKLKYNFQEAISKSCSGVITYGGMYSNHLVAVAAAGHFAELPTCGIIRSYQPDPNNPTIKKLLSYGMKLEYVTPANYRRKEKDDVVSEILARHKDYFVIPEGGTNDLALKGVEESINEIDCFDYSHIVIGLGTGGTLAGVLKATRDYNTKVIAVSPFKGAVDDIEGFHLLSVDDRERLEVVGSVIDVRFGGYHEDITDYIDRFKSLHDIDLDPVYTVKVMMTIDDLLSKDYFPHGSRIMVLHTGGLQGIEGYHYQYRKRLSAK